MNRIHYKRTGATFIGVMTAMLMMAVGLTSLAHLAIQNGKTGLLIYHQTEATSLVYDAFETLRAIRDTNVQERSYWNALGGDCSTWTPPHWNDKFFNDGDYRMYYDQANGTYVTQSAGTDTFGANPEDIIENEFYRMFRDTDTGIYNHIAGNEPEIEQTKYYRKISVQGGIIDPETNEPFESFFCGETIDTLKQIEVTIGWKSPGGKKHTVVDYTYIGSLENYEEFEYHGQ